MKNIEDVVAEFAELLRSKGVDPKATLEGVAAGLDEVGLHQAAKGVEKLLNNQESFKNA